MATRTMRAARFAPLSVYYYYVGLGLILTTATALANPREAATWIADALLPSVEFLGASPSPQVAAGTPPDSAPQPKPLTVPAQESSAPTRLPDPKPVEIASAAAAGSEGAWPKFSSNHSRTFGTQAVSTVQAVFQQGVFPSASYASVADTFIHATDATVEGTAPTLTVDLAPGPQAALVKFGGLFTSEGGPIPIGSTINSAILQVSVPTSPSNAISSATISFYALKHAWVDTNTYSSFGSSPWNLTAGIQVGNTAETEAAADAARTFPATGFQTVDVTSRVQAWSNDPASNFGWVVDEGTALDDGFIFESSEAATSANRPKLTVTYTPQGACLSNADCPDGNPCTDDVCDVGTGTCSHPNNDANACNDADLCTLGDFCSAGDCTGTPVSCSGGLNCNPSNGQCESGEVLVRQPYLQQATPTSMTIVWRSATAGDSRVRYGTTQGVLNQTATNPAVAADHIVTITGLAPATRYYYDVGTTTTVQGGGTANHFFKTSPPANDTAPFRVWALGDSGQGNTTQLEVRDAMLAYTSSNPPDLMIHMGDIAYSAGTDSELTNKHFAVYQDTLRHTPSWPTLGNHEGASTTSGSPGNSTGPYYSAFVLPTNGEAGGVASGTEAYYSFDRGNTHFIVLNSFQVSRSASGPMAVWLQADLAATNKQWVIAFWHHPPYSKGTHNSDAETELIDMRQNLLPILEAGGVDLVITGHSHNYERSYLIDGTYSTPTPSFSTLQSQGHIIDSGSGKLAGSGPYHKNNGMTSHEGAVFVVAGHGGATPDAGNGSLNHPVMYFSEADRGSCVLDISETALTLTNVRSTGVISDNFTIEKGVFSSPTSVTFQQTVNGYAGTQDTVVHQNFADTVEGSAVSWKWDTEDPVGFAAFGLIRFDNIFGSGAGQIPVGSTITSATLTLVGFNSTVAPAGTVNEVAVDWQASTATWNNFGGDAGVQSDEYRASPSYTAPLLTGALTTNLITAGIDVTASLQSWSSNPALNFGWVFRPNSTDGAEVYSAEQTPVNQRPLLTVTYTPPATSCTLDADCNDNNPCNGTETCVATVCQAGTALSCDDGNVCTTDTCNTSTGCVHTNNTASCTDGNACTTGDVCSGGVCVAGAATNCDDLNVCTTDSCNNATGCVHTPLSCPSGQSCNPANGQCQAAQSLPIAIGDTWKYFKGTVEPSAAWATTAFDDSSWLSGPSGFGYGDSDDATVLSDMQGATQPPGYVAVYARKAFSVPNPAAVGGLDLIIDYDDGFVAYLNGTEVARRNMTAVTYNSIATASHEASAGASGNPPETISLNAFLGSLVTGTNVLAIHGANQDVNSSDLSLIPRLVATAPANTPPTAPSLPNSPANGATGVATSPQLCVTPTDANGDPLTVTFKGRQGGGGSGTPFTVIAMPDTQFYSESFPTTYESQTMWVRDNRVARNIVISVGLGDCVNVAGTQAQWDNANSANSILENPATTGLQDGIPYGIAVGNHDQNPINQARSGTDENITTLLYNQTFPKSRFQGRNYFGGQYALPGKADSMDNHYELFSASGMDFIVFYLEWDDGNCTWPSNGSVPTGTLTTCQNVMVWMRDLLVNTYPNRRAIIASHYVGSPGSGGAGTMALSNQGQAYLNLAKPLPNVFLMVGGHLDQSNHRVDLANDGHPIYTVVSDYQTRPNGGNGWLRIMTFDPAADTIHIETYSPTLGRFINKPTPHADDQSSEPNGNELTLAYDMDAGLPFQTIGANSGVASGSQTCVTWPGLTTNQQYEWKVDVSDGISTTTSSLWSFTTLSCTVNGDCSDANPCTTDTCQAGVCNHSAVPLCCTTAAQCDDSNTCTTDSCNAGNTCDHVNNTASCNDGNSCTTGDTCAGGFCVGGAALNCDDGNPCTNDSCVPATGCAHANNTASCNDGNACTTPDACSGGACGGTYAPSPGCCTTNANCNDGNAGTTDTCTAGNCSNVQVTSCATNAECNDGDTCTNDVCNGPNVAALGFDGTNDYVTMGAAAGEAALGARNFTLEAWIRYNGTTWGVVTTSGTGGITGVPLITKGRAEADNSNVDANYFLGIVNGKLAADFEQFAAGGSPSFPAGQNRPACGTQTIPTDSQWHHVAVTYSTTLGWNFYVDGALGTAADGTSCSLAPTASPCTSASQCPQNPGVEPRYDSIQHFGLGTAMTSAGVADGFFAGSMDEVRVWNVARTQAEIQASMNLQLTSGTGLIGRWGLNEGVGTTAADSTTPAENGTLTNGPTWSTTVKPSIGTGTCAHTPVANCCNTAAQCDDGNPCTNDSCVGNVCQHTNNTAPCNDGNACTTSDACSSGVCTGTAVVCTASDQCHNAGTCDSQTGLCSNPAKTNGSACNDGLACTTGDVCTTGVCGGTAVVCTASDQCHDAGTCDTQTGLCSNPAKANGTSCTDGNACTQSDTCQGGTCSGANPIVCTASDQCHDVGTCNTSTGLCSNPAKTNGTACNDGLACTTSDVCTAGNCGGTTVVCTALDQCHTAGTCNPGTGVCSNPTRADGTSCDDANICTSGDACSSGSCAGSPIANCCTTAAQCDDNSACTSDSCSTSNAAAVDLDGTNDYIDLGNDGNTANVNYLTNFGTSSFTVEGWFWADTAATDTVSLFRMGSQGSFPQVVVQIRTNAPPQRLAASVDTGPPGAQVDTATQPTFTLGAWHHFALVVLRDIVTTSNQRMNLYLDGVLAESTVATTWGTNAIIDSIVSTTRDSVLLGAARTAPGAAPSLFLDGRLDEIRIWNSARTATEISSNMNQQIVSAPGLMHRWAMNEGTGTTAADSVGTNTGTLTNGPIWRTLAADIPTIGSNQCVHTPVTNGTTCSDGNACTTGDACTSGVCTGTALNCDDGNACTTDSCSGGICAHVTAANGTTCNDGSACTTGDACTGGTCVGTTLNCDDSNSCTDDSCNPATGCVHANNTAGCASDGNPCTDDVCSAGACAHVNNNANACTDGIACTGDACVNGTCQSWYAPTAGCCSSNANCNDGVSATTDTCVGAPTGTCSNLVSGACTTASQCNDSNNCTTDACVGSVGGSALNFDGVDDNVTMGAAPGLGAAAFTLEGWIKRDGATWGTANAATSGSGALANVVALITKGRSEADGTTQDCNYFLGITATGRLVADFEQRIAEGGWVAGQNHPICSTASIADQNWHHVAVTYDKTAGKGWRLYLDGAEVTAANGLNSSCGNTGESTCPDAATCPQNPGVDPRFDSIQQFGLGVAMDSTVAENRGGFFGGEMDEVRVWNRARTQAEIQAAMNQEIASATNLIGRWGLNENTGTTVNDSATSPTTENGTLRNAGTTANGPAWTNDSAIPSVPGSCTNTSIPNCSACIADYQCNDSNQCTADSCNHNGAVVSFPTPPATANRVEFAMGAGSNASPDYINYFGTSSFTIEGWVYTDGTSATGASLFRMGRSGDNSVAVITLNGTPPNNLQLVGSVEASQGGGVNDQADTVAQTLVANTWNHFALVVVRDLVTPANQQLRLHVNGGAAVVATPPASWSNSPVGSIAGEFSVLGTGRADVTGAFQNPFAGRLDEIRIWSSARTQSEIAANMNTELVSAPGLMHRWSFNAGTGTTIVDSVGGITGTMVGAATWATTPLPFAGTDTCVHASVANGSTCSDGNACTLSDSCQSGACTSGSNASAGTACGSSSDTACDNPDTCNGSGACQANNESNGTSCGDGNACNGSETCQLGTCTAGTAVTCNAPPVCHTAVGATCDSGTGACTYPAASNGTLCSDGNACTAGDSCVSGTCTSVTPVTCTDDGNACNGAESCNPSNGQCQSGPPATSGTTCSDGNACTTSDACDGAGLCVGTAVTCNTPPGQCYQPTGTCSGGTCNYAPKTSGTTCDDGNACTQSDACNGSGLCVGSNPVTCSALDQCHVIGTCNPASGVCSNPAANNGTACTDGNACTVSDTCQGGACQPGTTTTCTSDGNVCNGPESCNPTNGLCESGPAATAGTACTDGNACTQSDACNGSGLCVGSNPVTCSALDQCHVIGTCNPASGVCSNPAANNGTACTDGNACTVSDTCQGGACQPGTTTTCTSDGNVCNGPESCNPTNGLCESGPAATVGTSCTDGNTCTQSDACNGSGLCVGSNPVTCSALDQCHAIGTCNPASGVCSNPAANNGTACTDGNACTTIDACQNGSCVGTTPVICNDSNPCTDDACNPSNGSCVFLANNGNACTDGNSCTTDTCSSGTCIHAASGVCGIGGTVYYYRNSLDGGSEPSSKPVPSVGVDGTSDAIADSTTDGTGAYALGSLYGNVTLTTLNKYGNPRVADHNGAISSLDASAIARASVGLATLSPNQLVAGDVTGNGTISALDASQVARFAVGAVNHFDVAIASGSDWKFLRCNVYAYPGDPGCGAPTYNFTPISQAETGKNFYAVLYGDVTGNWQPSTGFATNATRGVETSPEELLANAADLQLAAQLAQRPPTQIVRPVAGLPAQLSVSRMPGPLRAGERRKLSIDLLNADGILGLDLGLTYDPSRIRIVGVETAGIGAGLSLAQSDLGGVHKIAAYGVVPLSGSGTVLNVTVEALKSTGNQAPLQVSGSGNEGGIPLQIRQQRIQAPAVGR